MEAQQASLKHFITPTVALTITTLGERVEVGALPCTAVVMALAQMFCSGRFAFPPEAAMALRILHVVPVAYHLLNPPLHLARSILSAVAATSFV